MNNEKGLMKKIKVIVQGIKFEVWPDFVKEGSMAKPIDIAYASLGEKQITRSGYVINELNARKGIALAFKFNSHKRNV